MINRFMDFYQTYKPRVIGIEVSLVNNEYGGTGDLVCELNGEIWYIDYKSGNAIYKSHKIQGIAFKEIWNEQMPDKITRVGCLHLNASTRGVSKNGVIQGEGWKLDEVKSEDFTKLLKLFHHAKDIWYEENPTIKPKNMIYPSKFNIEDFKIKEVK